MFLDEYLVSPSYTKHNITNLVFADEKNNQKFPKLNTINF